MQIANLASLPSGSRLEADLAIVGGGPAGLAIARQFFDSTFEVLILESGKLEEDSKYACLNRVESAGDPRGEAEAAKRLEFHGASAPWWSHESQPYGVRCRVFGGSTAAWAGKSATFDVSDFATRPWVPESGWPFGLDYLAPFLDRAAEELNLGPNCYDERLWELMGDVLPHPQFDPEVLQSFFWQFARSRVDKLDVMRFGSEYSALEARNVRVLLNATVTEIETNAEGTAFRGLKLSSIGKSIEPVCQQRHCSGRGRYRRTADCARLDRHHPCGLGNANDRWAVT